MSVPSLQFSPCANFCLTKADSLCSFQCGLQLRRQHIHWVPNWKWQNCLCWVCDSQNVFLESRWKVCVRHSQGSSGRTGGFELSRNTILYHLSVCKAEIHVFHQNVCIVSFTKASKLFPVSDSSRLAQQVLNATGEEGCDADWRNCHRSEAFVEGKKINKKNDCCRIFPPHSYLNRLNEWNQHERSCPYFSPRETSSSVHRRSGMCCPEDGSRGRMFRTWTSSSSMSFISSEVMKGYVSLVSFLFISLWLASFAHMFETRVLFFVNVLRIPAPLPIRPSSIEQTILFYCSLCWRSSHPGWDTSPRK